VRLRPALLGLAALSVAGYAGSRVLGSRSPVGYLGPLPPCPRGRSVCTRVRRDFADPPEAVFAAAEAAVRTHRSLLTGSAVEVEVDGLTLRALFQVGLFRDDLDLLVEPSLTGSALHVRSAVRNQIGQSDFGVNQRRVRALLADVAARLGQPASSIS